MIIPASGKCQTGRVFYFLNIMEVAEIKVSYSNTNLEKVKITNSQKMFDLVIS